MIDACRGSKTEKVFKPELTATKKSSSNPQYSARKAPEGDSANFIIIYATPHGKVAFSDENKGSRLTRAFVEIMNNPKADPEESLNVIINQVSERVQELSQGQQTVEMSSRKTDDYLIR